MFFDDLKVEHVKSPIVESQDFYPFGLTYNKFTRENALPNRWKFQGQEHVDELGLNWDSFKWRNHQPDIGRFFNVDPLAEKYVYNSPYAFSENKVIAHVELEGLEAQPAFGPGTNPAIAVLESFRRVGNAILSLFTVSAKANVTTAGGGKVTVGNTTVTSRTSSETSAYVKVDMSGVLDYHGNNEYVAPKMVTSGVKTEVSQVNKVKMTTVVDGVPVNTSTTTTINATNQTVTNTTEVSAGVDQGATQAKVYVNNSTTTQTDGSSESQASAGVKVQVPVYNDGKRTVSAGIQAEVIIKK